MQTTNATNPSPCRHRALPTLTELPPPEPGRARDLDRLLRLALISNDDAELRAAALRHLAVDEHNNHSDLDQHQPDDGEVGLLKITDIQAATPGGVAWKILTALSAFTADDGWTWWRYMLVSAAQDAIEIERLRAAAPVEG